MKVAAIILINLFSVFSNAEDLIVTIKIEKSLSYSSAKAYEDGSYVFQGPQAYGYMIDPNGTMSERAFCNRLNLDYVSSASDWIKGYQVFDTVRLFVDTYKIIGSSTKVNTIVCRNKI